MKEQAIFSYTRFGRWSRKYSWWLVLGMLVTAVILTVAGLIFLIVGEPGHQKVLFKVAKFLGAGGAALGSLQAFWKQIREKYDLIRLHQRTGHVVICGLGDKGKSLMAAFAAKGYRVIVIEVKKDHPDLPGCRERGVLALVGNASDPVVLDEANTAGARYLFAITGDDNTNIKIAGQGRVLAEAAHELDKSTHLRCYVHIASSSLRTVFAPHELFARSYDEFDASIFNIYETGARVILEKYPPDLYARRQGISGETLPVVIIGFGRMGENLVKQAARIGQYAEWKQLEITVIDRAVKASAEKFLAVYGDEQMPPSFIVPGVDLRFVDRDPECLSSVDEMKSASGLQPAAVYIVLDNEAVSVSLALRVRTLLAADAAPIVVCMSSGLSHLMEGQGAQFTTTRNIHAFNLLQAACGYQVLMEEVTDELARTIHSAYVNAQMLFTGADFTTSTPLQLLDAVAQDFPDLPDLVEQDPVASLNRLLKLSNLYDNLRWKRGVVLPARMTHLANPTALSDRSFSELDIPEQAQLLRLNSSLLDAAYPELYPEKRRQNVSLVLWEELDEIMKDANRRPADHLLVKLRAIGCDGVDLLPLDEATTNPEVLEILSEMEHRRWMAERLMDGWRYGPVRDNKKKIHHLLVPYEELSENERNKDKDMIQNIRNLVLSQGWSKQREFLEAN